MTQLTATLILNIDGNEYQKTVTHAPAKGAKDVCEWANQLIHPLEQLEKEVLCQSLNQNYTQWIKQRFIETKENQ